MTTVDIAPCRARLGGVTLVVATDVDNQLTGLFGAAKTFGPQKGIAEERIPVVDGWLEAYAAVVDRRTALLPGAGAAGGLGYGRRWPGHPPVRVRGRGRSHGWPSAPGGSTWWSPVRRIRLLQPRGQGPVRRRRRGRGGPEAVRGAGRAGAGLGAREMRALGIESAYAVVDLVGEERSFAEPAAALADLAERVARTWSRDASE